MVGFGATASEPAVATVAAIESPRNNVYVAVDTPPVVKISTMGESEAYNGPTGEGIKVGEWDAGLCDCFNSLVPNCLMVTFCMCVPMAQISHRLGLAQFQTALIAFGVLVGIEYIVQILSQNVGYSATATYYTDSFGITRVKVSSNNTVMYLLSLVNFIVFVVLVVAVMHIRRTTRERFQIGGSSLEDCLYSFFCGCCTIAQVATHIKSYTPGQCDIACPETLPAYEGA